MKQVIKVLLFALLLFLVLVGLKFCFEHRFALRNVGLQGEFRLKHVDILLVGSSHTRQGYDIRLLESKTGLSAYALAYDGLDFYHMLPLLRAAWRDPAHRPELCVLESYTANMARSPEFDDPRLFFDAPPRMKTELSFAYLRMHPGVEGWEDLFVLIVNRGTDQLLSYPLVRQMIDPYFYRGGYVRKNISGLSPQQFAKLHLPIAGAQPNPLQEEAFQKILELAAADHVEMILVDPPMPAPVVAQPEVVQLKSWFRKAALAHKLLYIDEDEGFPIQDPAMFADSNHVSTAGREIYTEQLTDQLIKLGFLKKK